MNAKIMSFKRNAVAVISVISLMAITSCSKDIKADCNVAGEVTESAAALAFTDNVQIPYDFIFFMPCANGGAGEDVVFTGTLHIVSHVTFNDNTFTLKSHFQPQGISGVGSITGLKYNATGVTQSIENGTLFNGSYTYTYVNNFKLIGQGPGNNFYDHDTFKVTLNANGTITVLREKINVDCK